MNKTREETEKLLDFLWENTGKGPVKPRSYRQEARKSYLTFAMKKKGRNHKKGCKKQLRYIRRNIHNINKLKKKLHKQFKELPPKLQERLEVINTIYKQQLELSEGKRVKNRIVSFHQPFVRPIVRGKLGRKTEFGAKINVSIFNGFARINQLKWDAYNEGDYLKEQVQAYYDLYKYYPEKVLADKIYLTRSNRRYLKDLNIKIVGKPLGREPRKEPSRKKRRELQKEMGQRNEVEAFFGTCKRNYGLNNIRARRKDTSESWIGMICLIFNLRKLLRKFSCAYTQMMIIFFDLRQNFEQKEGVIPVFNNIALNQRMIA